MADVYLIRHAEKDSAGILTHAGERAAGEFGRRCPAFGVVAASTPQRASRTAHLISGKVATEDPRAGFFQAAQVHSDEINAVAAAAGISFLEAAQASETPDVLDGIAAQAVELNQMIDHLVGLADPRPALVVSHDMSVIPAVGQRGVQMGSVGYLCGFVISSGGVNPIGG